MEPRQTLPRQWLMTDERLGDRLIPIIRELPEGSGIVFRHYRLSPSIRRKRFDRVRALAEERGLLLLLGGPAILALEWGADGSHGLGGNPGPLLRSAPVHDYVEMRKAEREGANLVFISPVFATRSHSGAVPLGLARFAWLARRTKLPVIALGGMNADRAMRLASFGAYGWAGIDAWLGEDRF